MIRRHSYRLHSKVDLADHMRNPFFGIPLPKIDEPFPQRCFVLARHLARLTEKHPALQVELIANPHVVSVTKREADVAVTMSRPEGGRLRARKLCDYELGLYASAEYLAGRRKPSKLTDVTSAAIIGYIPDLLPTPSHNYLREIFKDRDPDRSSY